MHDMNSFMHSKSIDFPLSFKKYGFVIIKCVIYDLNVQIQWHFEQM